MKAASLLMGFANLLTAMGIIAMAVVLGMYLPKFQTYLELKAKQDCAQSYRLEYTDAKTSTTVVRPVDDLYRQCVSDKGL